MIVDGAWQHLKPGGYVELHILEFEPQGKVATDSTIVEWAKRMDDARQRRGKSTASAESVMKRMSEMGYANISSELHNLPLNSLSEDADRQELGEYGQAIVTDELWPLSMVPLMRDLKWTAARTREFLHQVREEMLQTDVAVTM